MWQNRKHTWSIPDTRWLSKEELVRLRFKNVLIFPGNATSALVFAWKLLEDKRASPQGKKKLQSLLSVINITAYQRKLEFWRTYIYYSECSISPIFKDLPGNTVSFIKNVIILMTYDVWLSKRATTANSLNVWHHNIMCRKKVYQEGKQSNAFYLNRAQHISWCYFSSHPIHLKKKPFRIVIPSYLNRLLNDSFPTTCLCEVQCFWNINKPK